MFGMEKKEKRKKNRFFINGTRIWRRRRLIDLIDIGNSMGCDVAAGSKNRNFPWQWFCKFSSIYYWRKKVPIITWAPAVSELLFLLLFSVHFMSFSLEKKNLFFIFPFRFFFIVFYVLGQVQQQPNYIAGGEETGPKERDRSSPRFPLMVVIIITPTSECMGSSFSSSRKKEKKIFFFFFFPLLFCQFAHLLCSE